MNRKERTVLVTMIINLLLVAFKYWLAGASGGLALQASALHSVADAAISGFVFIGLLVSHWERPNGDKRRVNIIELGGSGGGCSHLLRRFRHRARGAG